MTKELKYKNGKNKFERNMTKLAKYLGISEYGHQASLHESNKYVEIKLPKGKDLFLIAPESCKLVKQGTLMVVEPLNSAKPLFFKTWSVAKVNVNGCGNCLYLVKGWGNQLETLQKCAQGADDITAADDLTKERVEVEKKLVFVNLGA